MSVICTDFLHVLDVVNDFLYFLGPDLKTVTGDVAGIDAIIHVSLSPSGSLTYATACLWK